jgi:uncharacterized protein
MTSEPAEVDAEVARLAGALREAGVEVATGQVLACRAAWDVVGTDPDARRWAGRTTLVSDPHDLAAFDRVVRALAVDGDAAAPPPPDRQEAAPIRVVDGGDPPGPPDGSEAPAGAAASTRERLRHRRFDRASDEELDTIAELAAALEVTVPRRRVRRRRPGSSGELDLPRSLERALTTDGELVELAFRDRRRQARPLVVVVDVSGSMAAHARALVHLAVAARRSARNDPTRRVEVFAFATRLTRLTGELDDRDPDAAIAAATARVVDWDGGTRIAASLDDLVRSWGPRGVLRGAIVVVCSDGLERGDPAAMGRAVARLRRHAHRLVWVSPLAGDPRYEPTQRGMAAALPAIDLLLAGHDLASLDDLTDRLRSLR